MCGPNMPEQNGAQNPNDENRQLAGEIIATGLANLQRREAQRALDRMTIAAYPPIRTARQTGGARLMPGFRPGAVTRGTARTRQEAAPTTARPEFKSGEFARTARTFGVEYEINFSWDNAQELQSLIGSAYHIVRDGSVRRGLEVVSPVMSGKDGEEQIDRVCKSIAQMGGATDETCGLHVHHDAKDFFHKERLEIWPLSSAVKFVKEGGNKDGVYHFVILHHSAIKFIRANAPGTAYNILRYSPLSFFEAEILTSNLSAMANMAVIFPGDLEDNGRFKKKAIARNFRFIYSNSGLRRGDFRALRDQVGPAYGTNEDMIKAVSSYKGGPTMSPLHGDMVVDPAYSANMRVLAIKATSGESVQLARLKRLAAFYTVFDDVIASMLPADRRANDHTRRANHRMSLEDIRGSQTIMKFLMSWFNLSEDRILEASPDGRPRGRYCGLNLYSLFKHGTIEIRYLGGTIDPAKIKHWVCLHQSIIELAADIDCRKGSVDSLQKASLIVDLGRKTDLFFKKLVLPSDTEIYLRGLIEAYKNADADTFQECVEEDNAAITDANIERDLTIEEVEAGGWHIEHGRDGLRTVTFRDNGDID